MDVSALTKNLHSEKALKMAAMSLGEEIMKNELTTEEIVKVFAIYLGTKYKYTNEFGTYVNDSFLGIHVRGHIKSGAVLLLKPLSSITEEDAIVVSNMKGFNQRNGKGEDIRAWNGRVHVLNNELRFGLEIDVYMYLVSRGYSVPLFFSPGHWANGRDAITLGIAIDKTKLNGV